MTIPKAIDQAVRTRARERCEYCRTPQSTSKLRFWIDHIIASQHRGSTILDNLALSCPFCNRHKGPNLAGIDPWSGQHTLLFNPRLDDWYSHFRLSGIDIEGITDIGRATVQVLAMNHPIQLMVRRALMSEGLFSEDRGD